MVLIENLDYAANSTSLFHGPGRCVLFQRLSVIVVDVVFVLGARSACSALHDMLAAAASAEQRSRLRAQCRLCLALTVLNPGLLLIDHIHFQYNGFLFGLLLWCDNPLAAPALSPFRQRCCRLVHSPRPRPGSAPRSHRQPQPPPAAPRSIGCLVRGQTLRGAGAAPGTPIQYTSSYKIPWLVC